MPVSNAAIEGVSGSIGAVLSLCATYPLLTVSTLKALQAKQAKLQANSSGYQHFNPIRDVYEVASAKGWRALFAGLRPAIVATAVSQGIYFYVYSYLRQMIVRRNLAKAGRQVENVSGKSEDIGVGAALLVAGVAGCVNVVATNPLWVIITQMQAMQKHSDSAVRKLSVAALAKNTYNNSGIAGFFKGVWPSMIMVSNPTIQYILYEALIAELHKWRQKRTMNLGQSKPALKVLNATDVFLLSAIAKLGATLATYPILVIKNRLQSMNNLTDEEMRYKGISDAVKRMWECEGLQGFFKGMKIKMLQTVLAAALLMVLKEELYRSTKRILLRGYARKESMIAR